jgi:hypothetical protein
MQALLGGTGDTAAGARCAATGPGLERASPACRLDASQARDVGRRRDQQRQPDLFRLDNRDSPTLGDPGAGGQAVIPPQTRSAPVQ